MRLKRRSALSHSLRARGSSSRRAGNKARMDSCGLGGEGSQLRGNRKMPERNHKGGGPSRGNISLATTEYLLLTQLADEPGPGQFPVAHDALGRNLQDLGRFFHAQAAKKAQFDHARFSCVHAREV